FRSYGRDVTRPYVRALEARHLPHLLVGGSSFHAREEVEAIRNALAAIERPEDDLAVFATLRGPFFALDDRALPPWRPRPRAPPPQGASGSGRCTPPAGRPTACPRRWRRSRARPAPCAASTAAGSAA